ncbi:TspO/MBR family protein [Clostridium sp.]|uniref:TspO/MBR family protein n=1 Tax=Clostridium sp. TaxID=1506 RepID=UPI0026260A5F|nr:TspO/MBR family protein [Clostridium sp.]
MKFKKGALKIKIIKKNKKFTIWDVFRVEGKIYFIPLFINLIIPVAVGALVGYLNKNSFEFYKTLEKPFLSPPAIIFPIVWTILYILMGIAAYRYYMKSKIKMLNSNGYFYYIIQLICNFAWTFLFFTFRLYGLSFLWIIVILILVLITTVKFFKLDKIAGILMIPYIIWLSFAGLLNYFIWMLNEM